MLGSILSHTLPATEYSTGIRKRAFGRSRRGIMYQTFMRKKSRGTSLPEWASQITALREHLEINQAELARRMECSAMTISRWERGLLQPSAEHFIQLGNLGTKSESWFFWEKAGVEPAKMIQALSGTSRKNREVLRLELGRAGAVEAKNDKIPSVVGVPLLKGVAGTHGVDGDRRSLRTIPVAELIGAPASWCPNPTYTSLLRVKGRSMEPLIRQGDIIAVDSYQIERSELYGKIVVVSSHQHGLCVSRLRRYDTLDVLQAENREYEPLVLSKSAGWRIAGKVLWWIASAP
jgi:SOS-response transcriptional repressor LexA